MAELPIARIEPQATLERVVVAAEPVARVFVWVGRIVDLVVRISLVAAMPALIVGLFWLLL